MVGVSFVVAVVCRTAGCESKNEVWRWSRRMTSATICVSEEEEVVVVAVMVVVVVVVLVVVVVSMCDWKVSKR